MRRLIAIVAGVLALSTPATATVYPQSIYIPRIKLYSHLASQLDQGPIVYYRSSTTLAIAAHRTWYPAPFNQINRLQVGDLIRVAGHNYHVRKTAVVHWNAIWVLNYHGLVLSACSRADGTPTSSEYRFVVFAS